MAKSNDKKAKPEKTNRICLVEAGNKKCGHVVASNAGIYNHLRLVHKKGMTRGKTYEFTSKQPKVIVPVEAKPKDKPKDKKAKPEKTNKETAVVPV